MTLGEGAHDLSGTIFRAIIHHDDFSLPVLQIYVCQDSFKGLTNTPLLVVRGNRDAVVGAYNLSVWTLPDRDSLAAYFTKHHSARTPSFHPIFLPSS
jgi:hypothetical protein